MDNVVCECCYIRNGWIRICRCEEGPTRTDPDNPLGIAWPRTDSTMGRNERDCETPDSAAMSEGGEQA